MGMQYHLSYPKAGGSLGSWDKEYNW